MVGHHASGRWKAELLGAEAASADPTGAATRIGIRYGFEHDEDHRKFMREFPSATDASVAAGPTVGAPAAPALESPTAESYESDDGFAEGARRILASPEPVSAGKVHLLGLDKVKAHFGDHWDKLAPRVDALVQRTIERRLSPRDIYRKTGPLSYVILFGDLAGREADLKCSMMADEISRMLVGEEMGGGALEVQSVAAAVDGAEMLERIEDPTHIVSELERTVEQERQRRAAEAAASFEAEADDPLTGVHFVYRPMWNVRHSVVTHYYCTPMRRAPGRSPYSLPLPLSDADSECQMLDRKVISRAIEDLAILRQKGRRLALCLPIHFSSLATPARRSDFLESWQKIPVEYRKLAVFEIVGAPEGIPQSRVADLASALRGFAGGIFFRVPLATATFRDFNNTGVVAVGLDMASVTAGEDQLLPALQRFADGAEKARLLSYVHGLRSFSLTLATIASGFAFIDGDPISSVTERPDVGFRLNVEDAVLVAVQAGIGLALLRWSVIQDSDGPSSHCRREECMPSPSALLMVNHRGAARRIR